MKLLLLFFGICSLAVGVIGIILPILPTTPFLLLALYFFTQSSKRLEEWFLKTKIYHKYLSDFHQNQSMTKRHKITVLLLSDGMILISFLLTDSIIVRVALVLIEIIKYWYFITKIKTSTV
jgi:hypothetical protein